jgi:hypothetical protein
MRLDRSGRVKHAARPSGAHRAKSGGAPVDKTALSSRWLGGARRLETLRVINWRYDG